MSVVPRNKRNIGVKYNKKNKNKNAIRQSTKLIDSIYDKHKVGEFSVCRSAKLITHDGTITEVVFDKVVGNMRASVLVFKSSSLTSDPESKIIYDLVQIQHDKKERDRKKYECEAAETKDRMDILHKTDTKLDDVIGSNTGTNSDSVHNNIMEMLDMESKSEIIPEPIIPDDESNYVGEIDDIVPTEPLATELKCDSENQVETLANVDSVNTISPIDPINTISPVDPVDPNLGKKRIDISINAAPVPVDLPKKIAGNKFHRHFISDLTSKFKLEQYSQYKYLELKVESSFMLIENPGVFRISVTDLDKDILIIGDLQLKSGVVKQIDPNYGATDVLKDQEKFMEQIKTKESDPDTEDMPALVPIPNTPQKPLVDFPDHFQPGVITKNSTESDTESDTESESDIVII